jgi:hypothetical protein
VKSARRAGGNLDLAVESHPDGISENHMDSRKQTARLAGALYLLASLPAAFALIYVPSVFLVNGDAAATASRIAASPGLYRFGVFAELVSGALNVCMAMVMYELFKDVDRRQARLLVGFVFGMVMIGAIGTVLLAGPLVMTSGAKYLAVFDKQQLDALTQGFWGLRNRTLNAATLYWGLWLLPLGALVYKSRFLPRLLGVLVFVAGCAYVIDCFVYFFFPRFGNLAFQLSTLPQGLGEGGFMLYTLIKGAREYENRGTPAAPL